mgnify:CR=1 FL=1
MSVAHIRFGNKKQVSLSVPEVESLKKLPDLNLELDSWKGVERAKEKIRKSRARPFILEPPNFRVGVLQKSNLRGSRHRGELLDRKDGKFEGLRTVWKILSEEVSKKGGDLLIRVPTTHSVQAMEGLDRLLANLRTHVHEDKHLSLKHI